jgi:hypothetical protein
MHLTIASRLIRVTSANNLGRARQGKVRARGRVGTRAAREHESVDRHARLGKEHAGGETKQD